MDFKRIQIILIVTFSVLNLYLLSVLLDKNESLNFGNPSSAVNLQEGLRSDNIKSPELSTENVAVPFIKTEKDNYLEEHFKDLPNQKARMENNKLISMLTEPIKLNLGAENALSVQIAPLQEFIDSGNILKGEEYTFLSYQVINRQIIFMQSVNGIPIADSTGSLIFTLNEDREVVSYEQTHTGPAEVQGRDRTVISEQNAIESLYLSNQIPNKATIKNLTLSYFQTLSLDDMNIYSPMWYVEIALENVSVQVKRVDALTGNIITISKILEPESSFIEEKESKEKLDSENSATLHINSDNWLDASLEGVRTSEQRVLFKEE